MRDIEKYTGLLIVFFLLSVEVVHGQFYETINSGRPGQSIGAYTVGRGVFQLQSGFNQFGYTIDDQGVKESGCLTNTGARYGLTDKFELGLFFEYKSETVTTNDVPASYQGLSDLMVGVRRQLVAGKGIAPSIGMQVRLRLPAMSNYYRIDNAAPSFVVVTSQKLSESFTLITNLGAAWNGTDATPVGTYTMNLSWSFTKNFGVFLEGYGSLSHGKLENRMDTGVAWLLTRNLQLDLFGGIGRNGGLNDYFVSTGFSWRTHRAKNV